MKKLILSAIAVLAVVFSAQAQTNKEAIEAAKQKVDEHQAALAEAVRAADQQAIDSQKEIDILRQQSEQAQAQYNQGKKSLSVMKESLKAKKNVIKAKKQALKLEKKTRKVDDGTLDAADKMAIQQSEQDIKDLQADLVLAKRDYKEAEAKVKLSKKAVTDA